MNNSTANEPARHTSLDDDPYANKTLNQLNRILNTITDGILVVDTQGNVLYVNQAAEHLLGRGSLLGKSLAIPVGDTQQGYQDINLIRKEGIAWAEMRSTPLEWEGKPGFVIGLRDITDRKQAELALHESEAMFHTLSKIAPVGIFRADAKGFYQYVNERWSEITEMSPEQALGPGWINAIHTDDRKQVAAEWMRAVHQRRMFSIQYRFQSNQNQLRWVVAQAEAELDDNGSLLGYVGTITDITNLKLNEERLQQAAAVFECTREGVMILDKHCSIILVNHAFSEITGYSVDEIMGKKPSIMRSGRHNDHFYQDMWTAINTTGHWQGEIWNRRKDGSIYPELMSISIVRGNANQIINYVGVFADISKLKASESELEFRAYHDPLTQLPNRVLLQSRLKHALDIAKRKSKKLAVLMLDLDRFKDVNDSFGHLAGDDLLQQVASKLLSRLRGVDTICRLGGDEFTVLLEDIPHPESAARVASEIIMALGEPWTLNSGSDVRIGVSIGIALYPQHGRSAEALMQQADTALYKAKNEGRNRYKYFSEELTRMARDRMDIEIRLRHAIEKNELLLYYQPQIDINSGKIIGAEALVRWRMITGEIVPPMRFIPIAEETGLITSIGNWVIREVCRQGKIWIDRGFPKIQIAANVSPHQFLYSDINEIITSALLNSGFPAHCLELEITESALMQREDEAIGILRHLHSLGVQIAIDDFGTGYSSLAYLKKLPVDVLKIDKSFVDYIPEQRDDREIASTIIAMAKNLGMKVLAEGVENSQQLEFLKSRACDFYQGYLVSRPLPPDEFEQFLGMHAKQ